MAQLEVDGNFSAFIAVAQVAGLGSLISDSKTAGTFFLPDDKAFGNLVRDLGLTPAEFLGIGSDRLKQLVEYHIVPDVYKVASLKDGQRLPTRLGPELEVDRRVQLVDSNSWARTDTYYILSTQGDDEAKITRPDNAACKAVIHVINTVLLPSLDAPSPSPASPAASPSPSLPAPDAPPRVLQGISPSPSAVILPPPIVPSPLPTLPPPLLPSPPPPSPPPPSPPPPAPMSPSPVPQPSPPATLPPASAQAPPAAAPSGGTPWPVQPRGSPSPTAAAPPRVLQATSPSPSPRAGASPMVARSPPAPPAVPATCKSLLELASNDPQFTALVAVIQATGFTKLLSDPQQVGTFFAPTNAAFAAYASSLGYKDAQQFLKSTDLLKALSYHLVPGSAVATAAMKDSQKLTTLLTSATSSLTMPDSSREATKLEIIYGNIQACKLLVHVVDTVLVPDLSLVEGKQKTSAPNASAAGQFVQAAGAVALGSVVLDGQANKQPSVRACAASCAGTTSCDTFNYCAPTVERCVASLMTLSGGSCELRSQPGVSLGRGIYVAAGTPDLSAGAPVIVSDSAIDGYGSFLGISAAAGLYNFDCRATYKRGMCLLVGMPSELAAACSADQRCVGFSAFPKGSGEMPDAMGYLLSGAAGSINLVWANLLNPASILYINASALPAAPAAAPSASPSKQPLPSPSLPPIPMPSPEAAIEVVINDNPQTGSSTGGGQDFLGAPIAVSSESLLGYVPYLGIASGAGLFDFSCSGSYKMGMCMRVGSAQDLAAACSADMHCIGFAAFPKGSSDLGAMGYLLGGAAGSVDLERQNLINPASVLYVNISALAPGPTSAPRVVSSLQVGMAPPSQPTNNAAGSNAGSNSVAVSGSQGTTEQTSDTERTPLKGWSLAAKVVDLAGENAHYFLQEVLALRKLRHTNVVNFFGVTLKEGNGMILMEVN
ncbi:hypothetical protein N2152v2_002026 [Parachlorella kessleri]